jgi:hypothetical protein
MKRFLCFVLLSLGCFAVSAQAQTAGLHPVRACFAKPVVLTDLRTMLPPALKDLSRDSQMSVLLVLALRFHVATGPTMPPDPWTGCGADPCACLGGMSYVLCSFGIISPPSNCTGNSCATY